MFAYLPIELRKGTLPISQQRWAQVRYDIESIYPVLPASGMTLLHNAGHKVKYVDAILKRLSVENFLKIIEDFQPELLIFETKTPIVKSNWKVVDRIKEDYPETKIAACGDHVTTLPEETLKRSAVDFIIAGGDFDVEMLKLADFLEGKGKMPAGIFYKDDGKIKSSGSYELIEDLDSLPFIDREILPWQDYHEAWRLYPKFMYIMTARGCAYRCTFCSWAQMLYRGKLRLRSVSNVIEEIKWLIRKYELQELFIDSDTFTCPKRWVCDFCDELIRNKIRIVWGCNGRVDNVDYQMLKLMKLAGCRIIKFGVESASQKTLDAIKKGYTIDQVREAFRLCDKVGIMTHATVMFGFPWETRQDILATINFVRQLNPYEAQFSLLLAYPGTRLFDEAKKNGWLRFPEGKWEKYDMSLPTLESPYVSSEEIVSLYISAWKKTYFRPKFVLNRITKIRSWRDIAVGFRGIKTLFAGHLGPRTHPGKRGRNFGFKDR